MDKSEPKDEEPAAGAGTVESSLVSAVESGTRRRSSSSMSAA